MTPKPSDNIRKDLYEYFEEYKYLGDGNGEINKSGFLDSFNTHIL
jgi:hypothetical protein